MNKNKIISEHYPVIVDERIFNGVISYWLNDNEIVDHEFNGVTLDEFEVVYGNLEQGRIIKVAMDLA